MAGQPFGPSAGRAEGVARRAVRYRHRAADSIASAQMYTTDDYRYMARALQLAARGLYTTHPNPRVGCVLVLDGRIVGEGWHERAGGPHAEIVALNQAGKKAQDATCYVTLEPCCHQGRTPPCTKALLKAGVSRVLAAMLDPNPLVAGRGAAELTAAGVSVSTRLLQSQALALNAGYVRRLRGGRPLVRCKLAMSLDGRTAMASGESQWITDRDARRDVQRLRARSSAIMTGIGTVLSDDPAFTVRDLGIEVQPLRVVVDPNLSTPETARILKPPGRTVVATATRDEDLAERLSRAGAEVVHLPGHGNNVDLGALLDYLGQQQVNEVLLETGAGLSGAMLRAGLIDEVVLYMAPILMGDGARGLFHLPGLDTMAQAIAFDVQEVRAVGRDWRITLLPRAKA
jgi:diaminohydroxyphosphoribosylaminopyrimidine deaminase/5-amino-6-(5-phosphoribosylamino)uracil reductase